MGVSECVLFCFAFDNSGSHGKAPRTVQKTREDSLPFLLLALAQATCFACFLQRAQRSPSAPASPPRHWGLADFKV